MKIHEYQAKEIFKRHGIPVPAEQVAATVDEALAAAQAVGLPCVIKAQVLVGGRGKAGGVKLARTTGEVRTMAGQVLGMTIREIPVRKVLVARAVPIAREFYVGITVDRRTRRPVMMVSAAGGVEIEEVARRNPEQIRKAPIDPLLGLHAYQARALGLEVFGDARDAQTFASLASALSRVFFACDASLAEVNPLVKTEDGALVALDAKLVLDDNGLVRHPELEALRELDPAEEVEFRAKQLDLSYVKLAGSIGCVVNGAGLAMATMDIIKRYGGEPANFLDIGGSSSPKKMADALGFLVADTNVRAIFINIFGGITRCDDVAQGLLDFTRARSIDLPIVARLIGTNQDKARAMLAGTKLVFVETMADGAQQAIRMAR